MLHGSAAQFRSDARGAVSSKVDRVKTRMSATDHQRIIVVLGMHRGGTSVIARALQALGVDLGSDLLPPVAGENDKGFFEDREIMALNDELINTMGLHWHACMQPALHNVRKDVLQSFLQRAVQLLRARITERPFGFKDPRVSRLLAFWQPVFRHLNIEVRYLIALRNPLSVEKSLAGRDKFMPGKSHILWLEHYVQSMLGTEAEQRIIVDYDSLLEHPLAQLGRMASVLDLPFCCTAPAVTAYVNEFLETDLRHTQYHPNDISLDPAVSTYAVKAYRLLMLHARDEIGMHDAASIDGFRWLGARLNELSAIFNHVDASDQIIAQRDDQVTQLSQNIDSLKQQIDCLQHDAAEREIQAAERDIQIDRLAQELASSRAELENERALHAAATAMQHHAEAQWQAITNATFWKATYPLRKIGSGLPQPLRRVLRGGAKIFWWSINGQLRSKWHQRKTVVQALIPHEVPPYPAWSARFDTPDATTLAAIESAEAIDSIIILRFDAETTALARSTSQALLAIIGVDWKLVLVFDESTPATDARRIRRLFRGAKLITPDAVLSMCNKAPLLFIQAGAVPKAHGPWSMLTALAAADAKLAFADEETIDADGRSLIPWFKPSKSRMLIAQDALLGRIVALAPESGVAPLVAQLLDKHAAVQSALRNYALSLDERDILHVPHVLTLNTRALPRPPPRHTEMVPVGQEPLVSIIIPTRDHWPLLEICLESIYISDWPANCLEIIIVDNGSVEISTLNGLQLHAATHGIKICRDAGGFNFSRLINHGAKSATGDILILLNNDTEVLDRQWLRKLVCYASKTEIGAVGAKLLYPDRTIQHAGVVCGINGAVGHTHVGYPLQAEGYFGILQQNRECLAVTGACIAVRRSVFDRVGGFDEQFRVAFNDIVFCLDIYKTGLQNICLADALLIHHESKSRGLDDTPEKITEAQYEARLAWIRHADLLRNDPYYSPCLSLTAPYQLADLPRRRAVWTRRHERLTKIMILSVTYARGHGVPVVIDQQFAALRDAGYSVIIAGPISDRDFAFPGCSRVEIKDAHSAAQLAIEHDVDLLIVHTPPFFSVVRWLGDFAPVFIYDHGEPPPEFFPDAKMRREVLVEKDHCLVMSAKVMAISAAVAEQSRTPVHGVIPLGNSHLGRWQHDSSRRRLDVRAQRGWTDKFVVLNVTRFHRGERFYKGIDFYAEVFRRFRDLSPELHQQAVFVLCGKGDEDDIAAMRAMGLTVIANVNDTEMLDIYHAADVYANFSRWEGYNLGIGQALAIGLPVVASDIPAHRAFGVSIAADAKHAALLLAAFSQQPPQRASKIWEWTPNLSQLINEAELVFRNWSSSRLL